MKDENNQQTTNSAEDDTEKFTRTHPQKLLDKAEIKVAAIDKALERSRNKIPKKYYIKLGKQFDYKSQKAKIRLHFEKEDIPQFEKKPLKNLAKRAATALPSMAVIKIHSKIHQVEKENVAVDAAHKAEFTVERYASKQTGKVLRYLHDRPYRRAADCNSHLNMSKNKVSLREHKLNFSSKSKHDLTAAPKDRRGSAYQKRKIKKQYAKAARNAQKGTHTARTAKEVFSQVVRAITHCVSAHKTAVGVIVLGILLVLMLIIGFLSVGTMFVGMGNSLLATTYVADDKEINDSDLYYSELETDLQEEINAVETTYTDYDEYRYFLDEIGHNPFELMAYLSARYDDFKYLEVQAEVKRLFDEQYRLEIEEEVEIRYRNEVVLDPDTGEAIPIEIPYEWYILNITLTVNPLSEIIADSLPDGETKDRYEVYMETLGNRQCYGSPFPFDWHSKVSSPYGYRIHPLTGEADLHRGVDIAVANGTPIQSVQDGKVTAATFNSSFGNYIVIEDAKGYVTKYAHCNSIFATVGREVKRGEVIATVGNTGNSTGNHLHLEALLKGEYLNPYYFVGNGEPL